jgi:hypothetical protein
MDTMKLGREMMIVSGDLSDDTQSCNWARIGQILTQLGAPRMPRSIMDMNAKDREIIADAITALQEKSKTVT